MRRTHKKGFTFIEALIVLFIFAVAVMSFYKAYSLASYQMIEARHRLAAVALANERMEQIRNTHYDQIGTVSGSPAGIIEQDETVIVNDMNARIIVDVRYVDDPTDGTAAASTDPLPDDYKRVQIYILWGAGAASGVSIADAKTNNAYAKQRVDLISQFAPPGGLETDTGNGYLSINVLNSNGTPLNTAAVHIVNTAQSIDYTGATGNDGNLLYSTPPATDYVLTISKAGYETVVTEPAYNGTTQTYDPVNQNQTVLLGQVTTATIITDPTADFDIHVRDPFCRAYSGVAFDFDIEGGRVKGTDPTTSASVYVLNGTLGTDTSGDVTVYTDTDADGTVEITGDDKASAGGYTVTLNEPGYTLWKLNPGDDVDLQKTIVDATAVDCNMIVLRDSDPAALLTIVDAGAENTPIVDAIVRLHDVAVGYDVSHTTDQHGTVYFPVDANQPLTNGETYDVHLSAAGYDTVNTTITVSGLVQQTITLTPN